MVILRVVLTLPFYPLGALLTADVLTTFFVVIRQLPLSLAHLTPMRPHQRDAPVTDVAQVSRPAPGAQRVTPKMRRDSWCISTHIA